MRLLHEPYSAQRRSVYRLCFQIYKGRKFNARKETTDEKYYSISIIRFYIRCTVSSIIDTKVRNLRNSN